MKWFSQLLAADKHPSIEYVYVKWDTYLRGLNVIVLYYFIEKICSSAIDGAASMIGKNNVDRIYSCDYQSDMK